jgi:hypothetical protein
MFELFTRMTDSGVRNVIFSSFGAIEPSAVRRQVESSRGRVAKEHFPDQRAERARDKHRPEDPADDRFPALFNRNSSAPGVPDVIPGMTLGVHCLTLSLPIETTSAAGCTRMLRAHLKLWPASRPAGAIAHAAR